MPTLQDLLTDDYLRAAAGDAVYKRGVSYHKSGQVEDLIETNGRIVADVLGTERYEVIIEIIGGRLETSCTCPYADDWPLCKHGVAVALTWMSRQPGVEITLTEKKPRKKKAPTQAQTMRTHLESLSREGLVEFVLAAAKSNRELRFLITSAAASSQADAFDLETLQGYVDRVFKARGFLEYSKVRQYVREANQALEVLKKVFANGHAAKMVELMERAMRNVMQTLSHADDSDGYVVGILQDLRDLHILACRAARPDPVAFAAKLFKLEKETDYDVFYHSAKLYEEVLGTEGLDAFRRLLIPEIEKLPSLAPGGHRGVFDHERFSTKSMVEGLAEATGDSSLLLDLLLKSLSASYSFLELAERFLKLGRRTEAIECAQRGIEVYEKSPDSRLRAFLAERYQEDGRHAEALEQIWKNFEYCQNLAGYVSVAEHAKRAEVWELWRPKALGLVARTAPKVRAHQSDSIATNVSVLVEIYLWEGEFDLAWKTYTEGMTSTHVALSLADARMADHPEDAASILISAAWEEADRASNAGYSACVDHLRTVKVLFERLGKQSDFRSLIGALRLAHKPKRNLIAMLDSLRW